MKLSKFLIYVVAAFVVLSCAPFSYAGDGSLQKELSRLAKVGSSFSFVVLGDNRSGDRVYKKIMKETMLRQPLFVINTGDIIPDPGDREEWRHFWDVSQDITVPMFLVAGNHDIDDEKSLKVWLDEVELPGNELYYSFTAGRSLFVVLNSCDPKAWRKISGAQFDWLSKILNPSLYEHQFVFLHHPLFMWKGASHRNEALDANPAERDRLHELFAAKRVDMVFVGHEHLYHRMEKDGVDYIVTGGAGAPLYGGKEEFNHFIILEVNGRFVNAKVIDRDGVMRNEFFLN